MDVKTKKKKNPKPLGLDQTKQEVESYIINVQAGTSAGLGGAGGGGEEVSRWWCDRVLPWPKGFTARLSMTQIFQRAGVVQSASGDVQVSPCSLSHISNNPLMNLTLKWSHTHFL